MEQKKDDLNHILHTGWIAGLFALCLVLFHNCAMTHPPNAAAAKNEKAGPELKRSPAASPETHQKPM